MDRVILGIHGLNNKVDAKTLHYWWDASIREGIRRFGGKNLDYRFELMYWADLLYPHPQDAAIEEENDPRYCTYPFKIVKENTSTKKHAFRQRALDRFEKMTDRLLHNRAIYNGLEGISDLYVKNHFRDLDVYVNSGTGYREAQSRPVREVILERFTNLLQKYKGKKILLVAHSMGSLIAFDLLHQTKNHFEIDVFLTFGSPLGQPILMGKLVNDNPVHTPIPTPEGIKRWYNLSDLNDGVAINYALRDDYKPNSLDVAPEDQIITNTYTWGDQTNAHAAYGYLQSVECAAIIYNFLTKGRSPLSISWDMRRQWIRETFLGYNKTLKKYCQTRPERGKKIKKDETHEERIHRQTQS